MKFDLIVEDNRAAARLDEMGDRAGDTRRLFRLLAPELYDAQARRFQRGFSLDGKRYDLVITGALRRSLTTRSKSAGPRGGGNILNIGAREMRFGTSVYYSRFLRKRGFNIVGLDPQARDAMTNRTRAFLMGDLR